MKINYQSIMCRGLVTRLWKGSPLTSPCPAEKLSQGGWCVPCVGSFYSFHTSKVTVDVFQKTSITRWYS